MDNLSLDIIILILTKLLWYDQLNVFQTCKRFNNINTNQYWLKRIKEDFPSNSVYFYQDNFYNYLSCRSRYLNSVLRIIRIYGSKINYDGFIFRSGGGTSLGIMINRGLLQQLSLISKLCKFEMTTQLSNKIMDMYNYMNELNKRKKFNIQKLIYHNTVEELTKLTKILVSKLTKTYPNYFKSIIVAKEKDVKNLDFDRYAIITIGGKKRIANLFYIGSEYYMVKYSPYDRQFKFPDPMIKIMQDMGIGVNSIPYLYKMKMRSVSGIWDKWDIIEDDKRFNIKDNWNIIEKYLFNQNIDSSNLIMETGQYYPM